MTEGTISERVEHIKQTIENPGWQAMVQILPDYEPGRSDTEWKQRKVELKQAVEAADQTGSPFEKNTVERAKELMAFHEGEWVVAKEYFDPKLEGEIRGGIKESRDPEDPRKKKWYVGKREFDSSVEAQAYAAREVINTKIVRVEQIRDQIDRGGTTLTKTQFERLPAVSKGGLHAAEVLLQGGDSVVRLRHTQAAEQISSSLQDLRSKPDTLDGLDDRELQKTLEETLNRCIPTGEDTFAVVGAVREVSDNFGKSRGADTWKKAGLLGRQLVIAAEGSLPEIVNQPVDRIDLVDSAGRGLDLKSAVEGREMKILEPRARRIINNYARQVEINLAGRYQDKILESNGFASEIERQLKEEDSLIKKIEDTQPKIEVEEVGARFVNREKWEELRMWRVFVRDAVVPVMRVNLGVVYDEGAEGSRVAGLVPKIELMREILESRRVREKIIQLYPRFKKGDLVFGGGLDCWVWDEEAWNEERKEKGDFVLLEEAADRVKNQYNLEDTLVESVALDVLRAWFVLPDKKVEKIHRNKKGEIVKIDKTPAWSKCFGPHDYFHRWWLLSKFPENADWVQAILETTDLTDARLLPKGETTPALGDVWEMVGKDIRDLLNKWDKLRTDHNLMDLLGNPYDAMKKGTDTANTIHELLGELTPDKVFELLVQKERFKYLPVRRRRELYRLFYKAAYDFYIGKLEEDAREQGGLKPGERQQLVETIKRFKLVQLRYLTRDEERALIKRIKAIPEKGETSLLRPRSLLMVTVMNPDWTIHHRFGNPLVLVGSVVGALMGIVKAEEIGRTLSGFIKKYGGWNAYGVAAGIPFFLVKAWTAMETQGAVTAVLSSLIKTYFFEAYPVKLGLGGFFTGSIIASPGIWMTAATLTSYLLAEWRNWITKTYEEQQREEEAIRKIKV